MKSSEDRKAETNQPGNVQVFKNLEEVLMGRRGMGRAVPRNYGLAVQTDPRCWFTELTLTQTVFEGGYMGTLAFFSQLLDFGRGRG